MRDLPEPLKLLADSLAKLPGLGPKSALRVALVLLKWPEARTRQLGQAILDLRSTVCLCERCGSLADSTLCAICADPARHEDMLCLVSEWDSLLALEDGGFFKGKYLILGGLLAPLDGVDPSGLEIDRLRLRLAEGRTTEVIMGLGTTLEAENTESYVKNLVSREFPDVKISRLAQGMPLGMDVKFVDKETLKQSLAYRQKL